MALEYHRDGSIRQAMRVWVEKKDPTSEELLQHLGLIGTWRIFPLKPEDYQVTIFDVRSAWLCRPMTEYKEDKWSKVCRLVPRKTARPLGKRKGFSGCGHHHQHEQNRALTRSGFRGVLRRATVFVCFL